MNNLYRLLVAGAALALLTGCNVFEKFDTPSGDPQLISAARACFDKGDLQCAMDNYQKLSAASIDIQKSEEAFLVLHENGATMGNFMTTFGNGGGGAGMTKMTELMGAGSLTKRKAITAAFQNIQYISDNASLRGLVRFALGVGLASEILSEQMGSATALGRSLLATTPASCALLNSSTCAGAAVCNAPAGAILVNGSGTTQNPTDSDAATNTAKYAKTSPDLDLLNGAISQISTSLSTSELGASGKFSTGASSFSSSFNSIALSTTAGNECYRFTLLSNGVGE